MLVDLALGRSGFVLAYFAPACSGFAPDRFEEGRRQMQQELQLKLPGLGKLVSLFLCSFVSPPFFLPSRKTRIIGRVLSAGILHIRFVEYRSMKHTISDC